MSNQRLAPRTWDCLAFGSVATTSSARQTELVFPVAGEVLGAYFVNGTTSTVSSGNTTPVTWTIYKNASGTASWVASSNSSVTGTIATHGTATLQMNTGTTARTRFVAGDLLVVEQTGGADNNEDLTGSMIQITYMLALADTPAPSAGTGPA